MCTLLQCAQVIVLYQTGACCFTCVCRGHPLQHCFMFDPCCSSAMPIFAQEVCWLFQSSQRAGGEGRTDDWRISVELWMSHCSKSYLPLSLKYLYHCCYLKFLWTPQGTVIYGTIKYNLHGYSFLNHKPTNCFDMLERAGWNSSVTYLWFVCVCGGGGLTYCTFPQTGLTRAGSLGSSRSCWCQILM